MGLTIKSVVLCALGCLCWVAAEAQTELMVYRSEFENVGDELADLNCAAEGSVSYTIVSGNDAGYYAVNSVTGKLTVAKVIADTYGTTQTDKLTITAGSTTFKVTIVDGYDYFISHLRPGYVVSSTNDELYCDKSSEWTVYNNLWGSGTAVADKDFRIAVVHKTQLPDTTYLIWDVPGQSAFASVWCYTNVFWGNRKNMREDLPGFPFRMDSKNNLTLDFDFQQLFGNNNFKIAMNMFMTNVSTLTSFSNNVGDLFFVFDQVGTYIPSYPYSLPDDYIGGKLFAFRYDDKATDGSTYERRRIIVKNNDQWMSGRLNIRSVFDKFAAAGYLNLKQYIYHIQLGIEVTSGFGAVALNKYSITNPTLTSNETPERKYRIFPNPVRDKLTVEGDVDALPIRICDMTGRTLNVPVSKTNAETQVLDMSGLNTGVYFVHHGSGTDKIMKR